MDGIPDRLLITAKASMIIENIVATFCSLLYFKLHALNTSIVLNKLDAQELYISLRNSYVKIAIDEQLQYLYIA